MLLDVHKLLFLKTNKDNIFSIAINLRWFILFLYFRNLN